MNRVKALVLLTGTSLALVGCGGDRSGQDPAAGYDPEANTTMAVARPAIDKDRFLARINRVCREAWRDVERNWKRHLAEEGTGTDARRRFQVAVRASLLPGIDFYIFDQIRRLGAPPRDAQEIERIIGPFQIAVELGWAERWKAYSIGEVVSQFETYNQRAARYGLDDCLVDRRHLEPMTVTNSRR